MTWVFFIVVVCLLFVGCLVGWLIDCFFFVFFFNYYFYPLNLSFCIYRYACLLLCSTWARNSQSIISITLVSVSENLFAPLLMMWYDTVTCYQCFNILISKSLSKKKKKWNKKNAIEKLYIIILLICSRICNLHIFTLMTVEVQNANNTVYRHHQRCSYLFWDGKMLKLCLLMFILCTLHCLQKLETYVHISTHKLPHKLSPHTHFSFVFLLFSLLSFYDGIYSWTCFV